MINMKIKPGFALKEVANSFVIVPTGSNIVDFSAMITINETSAFLWNSIGDGATEEELVEKLLNEYDVDRDTAVSDVHEFAEVLINKKVIE